MAMKKKKGDEPVRVGRAKKISNDSAGRYKPTDTAGRLAPTDISNRFGENSDSGYFFNSAGKKQAYGLGRTEQRRMDQNKRSSVKKVAKASANAAKVAKGKK